MFDLSFPFADFLPFLLVPVALALFSKALSPATGWRSTRRPLLIFVFSLSVYFCLYLFLPMLGAVAGKLFVIFLFLCLPLALSSSAVLFLRLFIRRRKLIFALGFIPVWALFFVFVAVAIHPHGAGVLAAPFDFSWGA